MKIPVGEGNALSFEHAVSKPGNYVELKALVETVAVMSVVIRRTRTGFRLMGRIVYPEGWNTWSLGLEDGPGRGGGGC
jgi:uncharacterized protein YcgI (DUF1989 family)